jgi:hypothetical protein
MSLALILVVFKQGFVDLCRGYNYLLSVYTTTTKTWLIYSNVRTIRIMWLVLFLFERVYSEQTKTKALILLLHHPYTLQLLPQNNNVKIQSALCCEKKSYQKSY